VSATVPAPLGLARLAAQYRAALAAYERLLEAYRRVGRYDPSLAAELEAARGVENAAYLALGATAVERVARWRLACEGSL
jgi:hypothetical protein